MIWKAVVLPQAYAMLRHPVWVGLVLVVFIILAVGSMKVFLTMLHGTSTPYPSIEEHFKYGSIGSDNLKGGLPYWVFKALPEVFSDHRFLKGNPSYEAFGLIVEPKKDRPVGFSKRRIGMKRLGVDMVGMNCAACHASRLRTSHGPSQVIAGMPSNTVDVERFFVFLFETAKDPRFTADTMLNAIDQKMSEETNGTMGPAHRLMYRGLIHFYRWEIGKLEQKFCFLFELDLEHCKKKLPSRAGPGRIDTWAPYKVLTLQAWPSLFDLLPHLMPPVLDFPDLEIGEAPGFADAASLWNLEQRLGRGFHWDGNTTLLGESSITAAVGSGATPAAMDLDGLYRIGIWMRTYAPPKYDDYAPTRFKINAALSRAGNKLYNEHCAACHSPGGSRYGHLEPIESIGTDRNRLDAFTEELAKKLNNVGRGYDWRLQEFTKTRGYSNVPLDGIWLRAPYLHNGSVPTLRHLLEPPENRLPEHLYTFYRGNDLYDWKNVGFTWDVKQQDGKEFFLYDTRLRGNGNGGHLAGTTLSEDEKEALLEYLKTL